MRKRYISLITIFIAVLMIFSMTLGCGNTSNKDSDNGKHKVIVEDTDKYLIKDKKTSYSILIPQDYDKNIEKAVNEINFIAKESAGVTFPVVIDDGTQTADQNFISIGDTSVAKESNVVIDEEYGYDGYRILTYKNSVILLGSSSGKGNLYAAVDFTEKVFNTATYAVDEVKITKTDSVKFKKLDIKEIPDFKSRVLLFYDYTMNETLRDRIKVYKNTEGWIYWSHSHFLIINPDVYKDEHPDWFSPDGTQLCLTNEEMTQEFIKNVKQLVEEHPDARYIMLGQQDKNTFCNCASCAPLVAKYKESGVQIMFVNKVAQAVDSWLEQTQPGRKMIYAMYAYQKTEAPPAVLNKNTNKYEIIDEAVRPRHNVAVTYAPLYASSTHNLFDEKYNNLSSVSLRGWQAVMNGKNLFVRIYSAQYGYYFMPFNNFSTLQENYNLLKEIGTDYIIDNGSNDTVSSNLQELKGWVSGKLMWNTKLNQDDLIREFAENYYKDAAQQVIDYIDLIRLHWQELSDEIMPLIPSSSQGYRYFSDKIWTYGLLKQMEKLFDQAEEKIAHYQDENPEMYIKLKHRIDKLRLTPIYFELELHPARFTKAEIEQKINFFEQVCYQANISEWAEIDSLTISSLVSNWRLKLLK